MSHPSQRGSSRKDAATRRPLHRLTALVASLLIVLGFTPAMSHAADAKVTQSDLCNAWNASSTSPEVTLASGYKITGNKLVRAGASCAAADASVSISGSAIAEVGTTSGGSAASRMLAAAVHTAVSESDIKVGDEVFKGASITSLTAVLQNGFIGIKGGIELKWFSGTVTKLNFEGRFYALDRFSLVLRSPAEGSTLPGVGGQPITFAGDLVKDSAGFHMNVNGSAPLVTVGEGDKQISISNATLKMTLANVLTGDGLRVTVAGDGGLGTAVKLTGATLTAEFDSTGLQKASGTGSVVATIPANGQIPEGKATGNAVITFERDGKQQIDFAGDVRFGDALVANAKGVLDAQTVTFTGDATATGTDLVIKGAVDGIAYFGDNLTGRTVENRAGAQVQAKKGDVLVKTATASIQAKNLDIKGTARIGDVAGEQWAKATGSVDVTLSVAGLPDTAIKGTADLAWVKGSNPTVDFKGTVGSGSTAIASATGTVDGNKIDLTGSGSLVNPDLSIKGTVDGVVYYGDNSGDQIASKSGAKVAAKKGDFILRSATAKVSAKGFELTGAASVARVGGDLWASGRGNVDLTLGDTNLKGSADMTWSGGSLPSVAFTGSVKQGTSAVGNVSGTVDGAKLSFKGDGSLATDGLTVKGAVNGVVYYGDDLSGLTVLDSTGKEVAAKKGDFVVKSATADVNVKGLALGANASFGSVAGKLWANGTGTVSGTYNDTTIKGSANLAWVQGQSPTATFEGTVKALFATVRAEGTIDGTKIVFTGDLNFDTAQFEIQGQLEGLVYYGDPAGATLPNAAGKQIPAKKGDFVLKGKANGGALVWNTILTGQSTVVKAGGDMYATGGGTISVGGGGAKISGTGAFTWQEEQYPVLDFAGAMTVGTTAVANATGTLDGREFEFKGDAKITDPNWTFSGNAEGHLYYGTPGARKIETKNGDLVTATKGDFYLKTLSGKLETQGTTVTGEMSAGRVAGALWVNAGGTIDSTFGNPAVTIKGSAAVDWSAGSNAALTFNGTVTTGTTVLTGKGVMDGKKIAFEGTAASTVGAFSLKGDAKGVVYYADPAGDTLADASGKQVAASKGDFVVTSASGAVTAQNLALTGKATLGKVGSQLYANGGGNVDLTYNGAVLKGSATANWINGQAPAVSFDGTVTYGNIVVTGKGTVDGKKVTIDGTAKATDPNYTLTGAAKAVYYYADPAGDQITDASGAKVAAAKGDAAITSASATITAKGVTVTGSATAGKNGDKMWVKGDGSLDATFGGAAIKGNATFSWATGTTGVLNFTGNVSAGNTVLTGKGELDGNKIALSATAKATDASFTLDGSLDGYVLYGDPKAGEKITDASGNQVAASKGDWSLTSAKATLTMKGTTVTGSVTAAKIGSNVFVKAGGTIDVTFGNPAVTIKGSAQVGYDSANNPGALTFNGTVSSGGTVLTGSGTMDGKKIAFKGDASSTVSGFALKGAVEGVVYYADPAGDTVADASGNKVAAQKGDFVVTSASGSVTAQNLALTGKATLGKVGSQLYANGTGNVDATTGGATLKGSATASWQLGQDPAVSFDGTITYGNTVVTGKGTVDGKKVTVKGTAKGTESGITFSGAAEAVYYYADPAGDQLTDASGKKVAAAKGDAAITSATVTATVQGVTLNGTATGGKNGDKLWIKGNGTLDATYGGVAFKGNAAFSWATGATAVVNFDGTVSAGNTVFSGKGELDGNKIALTATAKATDSSFTLDGSLSGYVYYGDPAGAKITNNAGEQVAASKGDWSLTSASATLTTKGTTVTGNISAGKVGSDIWIKAGGTIDVTFGNPAVTIKGTAGASYSSGSNGGAINFEGTVTTGSTVLKGSGVMDGKKIAFKGDASSTVSGFALKGAVEGIVFYAEPSAGDTVPDASGKQVAAQKGDFVVTSASGSVTAQNLTLTGKATLGKVGSAIYANGTGDVDATYNGATLKGSATASWILGSDPAVSFDGTVTYGNIVATGKGNVDGKKVVVKGTVKATDPNYTLSGAAEAVYYYADPAGEQILDASGAKVAAAKGDAAITSASATIAAKGVTVTGNATAGKNGDKLWVKGGGTLDATYGGAAIKGTAAFSWATGTTGVLNFDGTVSAGNTVLSGKGELDGNKIALTATAKATDASFTLDGSLSGYVYYGDPAGAKITNASGAQVAASKGDWSLTSAKATLTMKGTTVTGSVTAAKIGTDVWVKAGGSIDVTFGNPAVTIKGSANVAYDSSNNPGALTFDGTVTGAGVTLSGEGTMDGKKITFTGDASYPGNGFSVKGSATGVVYYADPAGDTLPDASGKQVAASKGDFVVTSATGSVTAQNLAITGKATLGKVGSQLYANGGGTVDATAGGAALKGSATFTWLNGSAPSATFEGTVTAGNIVASAKGAVDGKTIAVKGDVKVTDPNFTLTGSADGLYYYGDPAGDTITGPTGAKVAASKGDFVVSSATGSLVAKGVTLKGNVSAGKVGSTLWAKGGGSIDGTYNAINLKGSANFAWQTGQSGSLTFEGTVTSGNTVITGSGEMDGGKIAIKGTAKSSDSSWSVNGSLEGVIYYGDPAGAQIPNSSGTKVAAAKGDWYLASATASLVTKGTTVTGGVTAGKVGSDTWVKGGGSIDITVGNPAVNIKGSATASWTASGGVGAVTFEGTVTSGDAVLTGKGQMDGKKIAFQGNASYVRSGLSVKGAAEGYIYYADPAGETIANASGNQVAAQKGDFLITSATGSVVISNLTVSAKAKIGKVGDTAYVNGDGSVDLAFGSTSLKGSANFAWTGTLSGGSTNPTVNIDGVVNSGNAVINVKGAVDGKKISLKGDAKLTDASYTLTGSMDGVFYYGDPAGDQILDASGNKVAAQKGDFSLTSATGSIVTKGLTVKGNVSAGKNGSALWVKGGGSVDASFGSPVTSLKGSATFVWTSGGVGTLSFEGTVTQGNYKLTTNGTLNGKKLTFTGALSSPDLSGNGSGVVYYGDDLSGETIVNRSGQTVAASKGDFRVDVTNGKATLKQITATADFSLSKVGSVIWAKANAQIKVGDSWLNFVGEMEANGGNVSLKGSGNAVIDGYKVVFNGTATIQNNALTIGGTVDVSTGLFSVRLSGTLNKPDMNTSTYVFVGKGAFSFGGFQIADATIKFQTGEGITTQFDVKSCLFFLCTNGTYKLYFTGTEISKIQLSAPIASWPAFFAIAKITAPSIPVETKITGII